MQYIFQDEITACLVEAIRKFFGTKSYTKDWEWSPDTDKSKIMIIDSWADVERELPLIIINVIQTGTAEELGFGQALGRVYNSDEDSIGQYFGGRVDFDVVYEVQTYNKRETHRISDLLTLGLGALTEIPARVAQTSLNNLILSTPMVRLSGERQDRLDDQTVIHSRSLSQTWQSYWKDEVIYSDTITEYLTTAEVETILGETRDVIF